MLSMPRRGGIMTTPPTRFKIWISILKFDLAPKFGFIDEQKAHLQPEEDCDGMLRIWDGPLREAPVCRDINWSVD